MSERLSVEEQVRRLDWRDRGYGAKEALEAVLLFHSAGQWGDPERQRWFRLTGREEATTKVLCDFVRWVQERL